MESILLHKSLSLNAYPLIFMKPNDDNLIIVEENEPKEILQ